MKEEKLEKWTEGVPSYRELRKLATSKECGRPLAGVSVPAEVNVFTSADDHVIIFRSKDLVPLSAEFAEFNKVSVAFEGGRSNSPGKIKSSRRPPLVE